MARLISVTDAKKRDAQVSAEYPRRAAKLRMTAPTGADVRVERWIRTTDQTSYEALVARHGSPEAFGAALLEGDPEIPMGLVGRELGEVARVYVRTDGTLLSTARVLEVVRGPDGAEKSRGEVVEVEANVDEDAPPLPWTGRLIPIAEAVRKLAFGRALQLRHVSGLTFDFLFEMAKTLHEQDKLLLVGAGPKGAQPLIFSTNGAPYRGYLEGRVLGHAYWLVLHLTNLELKLPAPTPNAAVEEKA
jgi:hypothetical protein